MESLTTTAKLWIWTTDKAPAAWHFLTISGEAGDALSATALMRRLENGRRSGFGSIKVSATIGETNWETSVFPSNETGWMLPVKASVRKAEDIVAGDDVTLTLRY
jgi:hypothetical protein